MVKLVLLMFNDSLFNDFKCTLYSYSCVITVAVTSLPSHNLITNTWEEN